MVYLILDADKRYFKLLKRCIEIKIVGKNRSTDYVIEYPGSSTEYPLLIL